MALSDISWRVIELETHDAFMNMALDEACCEAVASGLVRPTVRFYRWSPSAVSIGYFQSLEDEINVEACATQDVDVIRRRTGGGAVYHDFEGEITYSVMVPEKDFCNTDGVRLGITESYREICGWIINGLKLVGIEAEFKPINDVIVSSSGKKISGNAQTRRGGVILQHGTILFQVDVRKMFSLLKVGKEKIADKMIAAVEERVTSIEIVRPEVTREEVYSALMSAFTTGKTFEVGTWSAEESARAQELVRERYKTSEWNEMR
ncbi:MAG: biotin/lipoate A/B protein ligase family protein [Candidatus Peregrinibacteria bacterium]|nr:biotin/lipoate A/B protein ligase family protein [Candidatus Peregrinibacteria bacterium]